MAADVVSFLRKLDEYIDTQIWNPRGLPVATHAQGNNPDIEHYNVQIIFEEFGYQKEMRGSQDVVYKKTFNP